MKKLVFALAVACLSVVGVYAQSTKEPLSFGGGINFGLPVGSFHNVSSFGVGVQLQAEYAFENEIVGVATTGYTNFFGKTYTYDDGFGNNYSVKAPSIGLIPILVGARFFPSTNFFVGAQIGVGIFTKGGGSGFDYLPQVGYNTDAYELILGYNAVSKSGGTAGNLSLTGIYKFGGK